MQNINLKYVNTALHTVGMGVSHVVAVNLDVGWGLSFAVDGGVDVGDGVSEPHASP